MEVLRANLFQPQSWIEEAVATVLGPGEGERRIGELHRVWRRRVVGRAALRIALARRMDLPPASLVFAEESTGKPRLVQKGGWADVHFSLARSGDLALIAISAAGPIGVDVEAVRNFAELERLASARFAPSEAASIVGLEGEARVVAFYECWTRKEAYVKAIGVGLDAGLESVEVSVGEPATVLRGALGREDFSVLDLDLGGGFAGAVAFCPTGAMQPPGLIPPQLPLQVR